MMGWLCVFEAHEQTGAFQAQGKGGGGLETKSERGRAMAVPL